MSQFHKIWIEMDIEKGLNKTELMMEIVQILRKIEGVKDITKNQYISSGERVRSELELNAD